jgi:hypothetical protein
MRLSSFDSERIIFNMRSRNDWHGSAYGLDQRKHPLVDSSKLVSEQRHSFSGNMSSANSPREQAVPGGLKAGWQSRLSTKCSTSFRKKHFDDLQAPASIDADVIMEDVSILDGSASGHKQRLIKDDKELSVLFELFANRSGVDSKGDTSTIMPVSDAAEMLPPVCFNLRSTPRKQINS